jgi:hypothetical protein
VVGTAGAVLVGGCELVAGLDVVVLDVVGLDVVGLDGVLACVLGWDDLTLEWADVLDPAGVEPAALGDPPPPEQAT